MKLPFWFRQEIANQDFFKQKKLFEELNLNTVCQKAHCPNINSCFSQKTATFMILGDICLRNCKFCAVSKDRNKILKVNPQEIDNIVETIKILYLDYVVITSVTRDDLIDGGASQFKNLIKRIHAYSLDIEIEILIPDFDGNYNALKIVVEEKPDVIGHNLETIPRLYSEIRPQADYNRSLRILKNIKDIDSQIVTKSGLMLGLGETDTEVLKTLEDLIKVGCDILTLGQYLAPSEEHCKVKTFVTPEEFKIYKNRALDMGFKEVMSGPLVRSSYQAKNIFKHLKGEELCTI
ncbi:MAG: lipoyl synthase [Candidatus Omnitrophota bacterium]